MQSEGKRITFPLAVVWTVSLLFDVGQFQTVVVLRVEPFEPDAEEEGEDTETRKDKHRYRIVVGYALHACLCSDTPGLVAWSVLPMMSGKAHRPRFCIQKMTE